MEKQKRKIIMEDGSVFEGTAFGYMGEESQPLGDYVFEIVFNTSMVGYQEILSDPSYTNQAVVMTYPLIGNYGINVDDYESSGFKLGALIVHEYCDAPSNFRCSMTLAEAMQKFKIPGIEGENTRLLTRKIRDVGSMKVLLTSADTTKEEGLKKLAETEIPHDSVAKVSTKNVIHYLVETGKAKEHYHIVAIDCGMKQNIVRDMVQLGLDVTVVPYNTTAEEIIAMNPDAVFISNGPGDPTDVPETIATIKALIGKYPIMGICLGHQIISLAYGAKTYKLKFGHRGGNHPVKQLSTGRVDITSQNHSYAVDDESLKNTPLEVAYVNLLDNTNEGVICKKDHVMSVQFHPEAAPGPEDAYYIFKDFVKMIEEVKTNA